MVLLASIPNRKTPPKEAVEIVLTRSCLGVLSGQTAASHLEFGSRVNVHEDMAKTLLVGCASGYYIHAEDDPTVDKSLTLTPERQRTIDSELQLRKQRDQERVEDDAIRRAARRALIQEQARIV